MFLLSPVVRCNLFASKKTLNGVILEKIKVRKGRGGGKIFVEVVEKRRNSWNDLPGQEIRIKKEYRQAKWTMGNQ